MENSHAHHTSEKQGITNISTNPPDSNKLNRVEIYEQIKKLQPISLYGLHKRLKVSYNTILYLVRDYEFAGLLKTKLKLEGSRSVRIITIPESEKKSKEKHEEKKENDITNTKTQN